MCLLPALLGFRQNATYYNSKYCFFPHLLIQFPGNFVGAGPSPPPPSPPIESAAAADPTSFPSSFRELAGDSGEEFTYEEPSFRPPISAATPGKEAGSGFYSPLLPRSTAAAAGGGGRDYRFREERRRPQQEQRQFSRESQGAGERDNTLI